MSGLKDVSFLSVKKPLKVKHEVKKVNHSEINYIGHVSHDYISNHIHKHLRMVSTFK